MSSHNEILLELYKMLGQITKILEENEKVVKHTITNNQKSAGIPSGYRIDNTMKEWANSLRN